MIVERTNKEIIVRLSKDTNTSDLQDLLDFLKYKELVSKSKATEKDIEEISGRIKHSMMKKIRKNWEYFFYAKYHHRYKYHFQCYFEPK